MNLKLNHSEIKDILTGPIFTVFTSFSKEGDINYSEIESYLNYLYKKNVRNFMLCLTIPDIHNLLRMKFFN